ncbi:hypothetical protein FHW12_000312 [Dokdonella fugitiva]|uniref:Uncharacterized protein n=1 Tax=Dokdonella fugitiva TaxID=328517 RepID=A0A839F1M1_9GAMM|nr:hypothetical protein [Dokdonella fugitiva]MBA8886121.1 hypothetical protein [Dokdonella fugitiva]
MTALAARRRKSAITRDTRWRDRKGREWKHSRRVAAGMHDCETVDGRFAGMWTTDEIRAALDGYAPTTERKP